MYGASILMAYEGDGNALQKALQAEEEISKQRAGSWDSRMDGGKNEEDEREEEEKDEDQDEDEDESPRVYTVKLIDFAHATWTPGFGPDENALRGVRNIVRLVKEMIGVQTNNNKENSV